MIDCVFMFVVVFVDVVKCVIVVGDVCVMFDDFVVCVYIVYVNFKVGFFDVVFVVGRIYDGDVVEEMM